MVFLRRFAPLLLALLISGVASAHSEEGGELKQWQEAEVELRFVFSDSERFEY